MIPQPLPNRRWLYITAAVVGAALVGGSVLMLQHNVSAPSDAGSLPVVVTSTTTVAEPPSSVGVSTRSSSARGRKATTVSTPSSARPRSVRTSAAQVTTAAVTPAEARATISRTATPSTAALSSAGPPAILHLPTLDVTAHVDRVDSAKGILQVPEDISRVGWWQHSATPGAAAGSTVIDGHIDSAVAGEGALFHLGDLNPGDPVSVTTSSGQTVHYQVQARRVYVKEQGLPADLFDQQGPARLVIISCGGPFDSSIHSYEDNIAVFATPTS